MELNSSFDELKQMILDERRRNDQHRSNFETLKAEHVALQDEFVQLQREYKDVLQELHNLKTNHSSVLQRADKVISRKEQEIKRFKAELSQLDKTTVREEVQTELEKAFLAHTQKLQCELEKYRNGFTVASQEAAALKVKLEISEKSSLRIQEELRLKHKSEITRLASEIESLRNHHINEESEIPFELLQLRKEHTELNIKYKSSLAEIKDLKTEKDNLSKENQAQTREYLQKIASLQENAHGLESKVSSISAQKLTLQDVLTASKEEQKNLLAQLNNSKEMVLQMKSQIAEIEHNHRSQISDLKLGFIRQKAEIDREKEALLREISSLKHDLKLSQQIAEEEKQSWLDKEKEIQKQSRNLRTKEWDRLRRLEADKLSLEKSVEEEKKRRQRAEEKLILESETWDREKHELEKNINEFETRVKNLTMKLEANLVTQAKLDSLISEKVNLNKKFDQLKGEFESMQLVRKELVDQRETLKNTVSKLNAELQSCQIECIREKESNEKTAISLKLGWEQEKYNFVRRIEELEHDIRLAHSNLTTETTALKQRNKSFEKKVEYHKQRAKKHKAEAHKLKKEREQLKKNVPYEVYKQLREDLHNLQRKHLEFHSLLTASDFLHNQKSMPNGSKSFNFDAVQEQLNKLGQQQENHLSRLDSFIGDINRTSDIKKKNSVSSKSSNSSSLSSSSCASSKVADIPDHADEVLDSTLP